MGTLSKNLSLTLLHAKGQGQGQIDPSILIFFLNIDRLKKKHVVDDDDDDYNDNVTCTSHAFISKMNP